jgi:hypothetical protein
MDSHKRKRIEISDTEQAQQDSADATFLAEIMNKTKQPTVSTPQRSSPLVKPNAAAISRKRKSPLSDRPKQPPAILRIPQELRDMIYEMVFQDIVVRLARESQQHLLSLSLVWRYTLRV